MITSKFWSYRCAIYVVISLISLFTRGAWAEATSAENFPPAIAELTITSAGYRMPALMYLAEGPGPHPTLILLHGFPGNEKNLDIAQSLRREGFNVLFFHYRGAWGAEGDYSITHQPDDVASVLEYLRSAENADALRVDTEKLSLLGHSMGGYAALAAGANDPDIVCVGAMAPGNVGQFKTAIESGTGNWILGYADSLFMLRGYSGEKMKQELTGAALDTVDLRTFGPRLKPKSVFLVNGDRDDVTPPDSMFAPIVEAYQRVPGLSLEDHIIKGDHSFSESRQELTGLISRWLRRDCD